MSNNSTMVLPQPSPIGLPPTAGGATVPATGLPLSSLIHQQQLSQGQDQPTLYYTLLIHRKDKEVGRLSTWRVTDPFGQVHSLVNGGTALLPHLQAGSLITVQLRSHLYTIRISPEIAQLMRSNNNSDNDNNNTLQLELKHCVRIRGGFGGVQEKVWIAPRKGSRTNPDLLEERLEWQPQTEYGTDDEFSEGEDDDDESSA